MSHPYLGLDRKAFWRSAISEVNPLEFENIYVPKFQIDRTLNICAAGSCFAQHIGQQFKQRQFKFLDLEPPIGLMDPADYPKFGYDMYSARYGNVYSARQLLQLFRRADGSFVPDETCWEADNRYFDPFRPSIEPNGFASREELERDVAYHLEKVNKLVRSTDLFVFTFGLTEAWISISDGAVLPTCPGTVAGRWDESKYSFHNFTHAEVLADMEAFIDFALHRNPDMKFLFTVSPVPLTATASGGHVLPATVYSKSVLRAVCGELFERYEQVDYFPSFELVNAHPMRSMFYNPNLRGVSKEGVAHVMATFFRAIGDIAQVNAVFQEEETAEDIRQREEVIACDELILETFSK